MADTPQSGHRTHSDSDPALLRRELADLSLGELKRFAKQFEADVMERLTVQGAIERKSQTGGTGRQAVAARLVAWEKRLA